MMFLNLLRNSGLVRSKCIAAICLLNKWNWNVEQCLDYFDYHVYYDKRLTKFN